ncbi:MAG: biotin--[acetyl-CoA-carboxylase] ligase [Nocardioides sp.]
MTDAAPRAPLDLGRLQEAVGPTWTVRLFPTADSTNALAAGEPEPDVVVVADHQTAGRGRLGREWVTPAGAALTFSAVVDPGLADEWWPLVPLAAGLAVTAAVGGRLKWPNDVLMDGRKVCGILVERVAGRSDGKDVPLAVVGIGLNVDQAREELPVPTATSLALEGVAWGRAELLGAVLGELRTRLRTAAAAPAALVADYRSHCGTLGQDVRVDLPGGQELLGRAVDVDHHGRLVVQSGNETRAVAAGDVVHVRPQG